MKFKMTKTDIFFIILAIILLIHLVVCELPQSESMNRYTQPSITIEEMAEYFRNVRLSSAETLGYFNIKSTPEEVKSILDLDNKSIEKLLKTELKYHRHNPLIIYCLFYKYFNR